MFPQSKHVMQEKQETLLDAVNKLKSDVDKGKEKSAQQKAIIRDLQQVWILSFIPSLLPPPPTPCFSFCLWQFSIPICSFVCMFVHQLSRLFGPLVRLLCLWSFSVYLFSVRVSFPPHPQSPVQTGKWNKNRHVLRSRCQFLSDRLVMRRYWKYNYISSLLFHLSGT